MLAYNMPIVHSVYHICNFCYWIDGKNQNRIDFLISGTDLEAKSI